MSVPPVVYVLGVAGLIGAAALGYKLMSLGSPASNLGPVVSAPLFASSSAPSNPNISLKVGGSTSLVSLNALVASRLGTGVVTSASSSEAGINQLLNGQIDISGSSVPLSELGNLGGVVATPVGKDAIGFAVSAAGSPVTNLTSDQITGIFSGRFTNWSQVGGPSLPIKVINRPASSGTRKTVFKTFGISQAVGQTLLNDSTTEIIPKLAGGGIGYATSLQLQSQSKALIIRIDGQEVKDSGYKSGLLRPLFYLTKGSPNPSAQTFLDTAKQLLQ